MQAQSAHHRHVEKAAWEDHVGVAEATESFALTFSCASVARSQGDLNPYHSSSLGFSQLHYGGISSVECGSYVAHRW